MPNEKVLILYSNYGDGHQQAARAIHDSLSKNHPSANIFLMDFMQLVHPYTHPIIRYLFVQGIKNFPDVYGFVYNKTRTLNNLSLLLKKFNRMGMRRLLKLIQTLNPSVVVSTFPLAAGAMSILKSNGLTNVPTTTVITDHTDHSYWVYPFTNRYIVGSETVKQGLLKYDIPHNRITITGIPIRSEFMEGYDRIALIKKHGLDPQLPTLLLMGGGCGIIRDSATLAKAFEALPVTIQWIVICGHNQKLKQHLEEICSLSKHSVHIKGFVEYVHELMAVSDVMVSKPGGLTISEALAMELPMIVFNPLPGQEEDNTQFLMQSGAAFQVETAQDLVRVITETMQEPEMLKSMRERIRQVQKKCAAFDAGEVIWQSRSDHIMNNSSKPLIPSLQH
ncbi:MGDG synthase family glycosyltransferase [Paenibacillus agricola]|uniref:Glycosyltransferase n=1 Tax=Paenibacillus agricola TaxID=2716264 RepID=A0ABX0JEP4_9BACL|nr:glycosyltransferase [Paenibacillus agricola]NHN35015.1 glycosyltransferase [Paenibacillus agricola]